MVKEPIPVPKRKPSITEETSEEPTHTIDTFLPKIIGDEGGYTDGKKDRRGPTNIGINNGTLEEYEKWKQFRKEDLPNNFTTDIKTITPELARQVYKEMYYERYGIDKIKNKAIAGHVLDSTINHGPRNPAIWLQESLREKLDKNIKIDGVIGKGTREAIEKAENKGLIRELNNDMVKRRKEFYHQIVRNDPSQKAHLEGWLDRADSFRIPPKPKRKPNF